MYSQSQARWHMPLAPALGRQRQISEFKGSLNYKVNSRITRAVTDRNPILEKRKEKKYTCVYLCAFTCIYDFSILTEKLARCQCSHFCDRLGRMEELGIMKSEVPNSFVFLQKIPEAACSIKKGLFCS